MRKAIDIVKQKQNDLIKLKSESGRAIDIVLSTINQLSTVNERIDTTIGEIATAKSELQVTEDDLYNTKLHNARIIEKFRNLIEV